jgi:small redox-active disulfide protein 2
VRLRVSRYFKEEDDVKITIYGPGCRKCHEAEELVKRVVAESGSDAAVEKVSDLQAMMKMGIISTPGFAVDGVLKLAGRVPKTEEIRTWLAG